MDGSALNAGGQVHPCAVGESRWWHLPLLALFAWHGWMTLSLFGTGCPWDSLCDDRPIVSGRHPLHLYHGYLGAQAFDKHGTTSCFDPSFQAGYPKTPVFDSGSRPAELTFYLCGGEFRPDVYKFGLALGCMLVPLALAVAARGAGLPRRAVLIAVLLGQLVWWGVPCQRQLRDGDVDLLFASLAALSLSGLLLRFDRKPGLRCLLGLKLAGFLAWFFHPLLLALLVPVFLIYYLSVGARHRMVWSVLLLSGLIFAFGANYFWLRDWIDYWWLRRPLTATEWLLPHRTFATLWRAPLWGEDIDRAYALILVGLAVAGGVMLNCRGDRAAARLLGLAAAALIFFAVAGVLNESLDQLNVPSLLAPGLLFAVPLAAHALDMTWRGLCTCTANRLVAGAILVAALAATFLIPDARQTVEDRTVGAQPLPQGLTDDQQAIVEALRAHTSDSARILWENVPGADSGWTCLLPMLTGRSYIGGLTTGNGIEHTVDGLTNQHLAGRPLAEWTDAELEDYCRRYNIGWVFCRTRPSAQRFQQWCLAEKEARHGKNVLFSLRRTHSYILKGKARWLGAEPSRIRLADVEPEDGEVVLSLHYQQALTAAPARVKVEKEMDPRQDIPFVRLRLDAPASHVTLVWRK